MKRFRDTEMWNEDWFISLPNEYKFFWHYILDTCNHAGIWKPSIKKFELCTAWKIDLDKFLNAINSDKERVFKLSNGKYWIIDFIAFQTTRRLSISNNAHKGILRELAANGIHFNSVKGIQSINLDGITEEEKALIIPNVDPNLTPNRPQLDPKLTPKEKETDPLTEKDSAQEKEEEPNYFDTEEEKKIDIPSVKDLKSKKHKWDGVSQNLFGINYSECDEIQSEAIRKHFEGDKVPF